MVRIRTHCIMGRERLVYIQTVQRCRVDDGPKTNTGVEIGQISDVEGTQTY
jgi:hypothetical protein